jgi:DNA-binding SARP family transcriptional activator
MHFRILGALEAGANGTLAELGPPKQRALLAILLMHVGEIVPTERLIDLLWGERPPRTAAHSVQIYVSELRKALEPFAGGRLIATRPPGYQLDTEPQSIDAREFERLVEDGTRKLQSGDRAGGAAALRSALALWRGPALSDFTYEEFAQPYIRRLHDLHLDAIEELVDAELESGRTTEVLSLLDSAIREDPLRERSRELLMLALYRSGRHAEALRTYQRLRSLLDEELGLEPSPPLQRMQERILLHDPSLLPEPDMAPSSSGSRNPYKGLRPFAEEDAADFFGREALVERLIGLLGDGQRLIALVGPSGSGKSSILAAGLIARLKAGAIPGSEQWLVAPFVPGAHPLEQVEAVVSKAGGLPVGLTQLLDRGDAAGTAGPALRTMPQNGRLVIVMDQFEELFAVADEPVRRRFLQALAAAVTEPNGQVVVLLALRADFYDRPLLEAAFADVFVPAVTNVLPMTTQELEAAVVSPAERVGVTVEPMLLAELVAETSDQAGALPLLQFALTELFDQRSHASLTLAGYRALGGLRGILSRRAEGLYAAMDADEQRVVMQVLLRLVRLGRGTIESRRRLPLADLTDLDLDSVALSAVLATFGRHRLLSFDRDPVSGAATVEVAHEALFREWDRLAGWIDRHRIALRRHETFALAVEEWELAGRDADYLLTGGRLSEFEAWSKEGTLRLTGREREFLEAGLARRRSEDEREVSRSEAQRRLEGRARVRLVALGLAVALFAVAALYGAWLAGPSVKTASTAE